MKLLFILTSVLISLGRFTSCQSSGKKKETSLQNQLRSEGKELQEEQILGKLLLENFIKKYSFEQESVYLNLPPAVVYFLEF